jgi:hypothetical protein
MGEIYKTDALIAEDIDTYLTTHQHKTCCASSPAGRWMMASPP